MNKRLFNEFLAGGDTLRIYKGDVLVFASRRERLLALLEYIDTTAANYRGVIILDKVMGNAAALLSIKAGCSEVWSPLGSQLAVMTLDEYGIRYHLSRIVPLIMQTNKKDICPMEGLSLNKSPQEFHKSMKRLTEISTIRRG